MKSQASGSGTRATKLCPEKPTQLSKTKNLGERQEESKEAEGAAHEEICPCL